MICEERVGTSSNELWKIAKNVRTVIPDNEERVVVNVNTGIGRAFRRVLDVSIFSSFLARYPRRIKYFLPRV